MHETTRRTLSTTWTVTVALGAVAALCVALWGHPSDAGAYVVWALVAVVVVLAALRGLGRPDRTRP